MLEDLRHSNRSVGLKQSIKAIESGDVKLAFIAKDADKKIVETIENACVQRSITVSYADNMKQLGRACGIEVGAAVACVLK